MISHRPQNYDRVTGEAMTFAESAARSGWVFDQYIGAAKEAWVLAHEDALKQARYQVENAVQPK